MPLRYLAIAGVLVVALLARLTWWALADVDVVGGKALQYDMTWYRLMGLFLAQGVGLVRPGTEVATAAWPPGYPAFLAAVFQLSGGSFVAVQGVQIGLSTATCFLTYALGGRLFGRHVGLAAATMMAICPDDVFFTSVLMTETVFTFVLMGISLAVVGGNDVPAVPSNRHCLIIGVAIGLASLIRGTGVLLAMVPPVVWCATSRSLGASARHFAVLAAGMALTLAPWAVRNHVQIGAPVPVSTEIGEVLFVAHSPIATGGLSVWDAEADPAGALEHWARVRAYRFRFDHLPWPAREVEEMRAEVRRAAWHAVTHPVQELALVPERIGFLFRHGHAGLIWGRRRGLDGRGVLPLLSPTWDRAVAMAGDWHFFATLGLALLGISGLLFSRARRAAALVPVTVLFCVTAQHGVVFFGDPRFHVPLLPMLAILAALPCCAAVRRLRGGASARA